VVSALSTEIVTLGAGGGSIVSIGKAGEFRVGPESAGADPGPACYGKGGRNATITDAALAMGLLAPDRFVGGALPLEPELAAAAFEHLDSSLPFGERVRQSWMIGLHHIAEGILDITIRRGADLRDFSLVAFGAAGPMLLPGLLDLLPLPKVVVPPNPGGFSAQGLLSSDQVFSESRTLYGLVTPEIGPKLNALFGDLEADLVSRAGLRLADVTIVRSFDGRLLGQGWETPFVPVPGGSLGAPEIVQMIESFHAEYEQRNGHRFEAFPVEGVTYRVQVLVPSDKVGYEEMPRRVGAGLAPVARMPILHLYDDPTDAECYERDDLLAGDEFDGPAIVWEDNSTTFVPRGCSAEVGAFGELVVTKR
jgi:N-methylhydantoinase A